MRDSSHLRIGFTLVELLVAVAVAGVVLSAIAGLVVSSLQFSSASLSQSDRIRELTNATSYVVDKVRGATENPSGTFVEACTSGSDCLAITVQDVVGLIQGPKEQIEIDIVDAASVASSWLSDDDVGPFVLVERRLSDGSEYLILSGLTANSSITVSGQSVVLSVEVSNRAFNGVRTAPRDGAYTVAVTPRNLVTGP